MYSSTGFRVTRSDREETPCRAFYKRFGLPSWAASVAKLVHQNKELNSCHSVTSSVWLAA